MVEPTAVQWAEIDALILSGNIIGALVRIRSVCQAGLNDAEVVHGERYRHLRATRPAAFACTDEEYWREVYG